MYKFSTIYIFSLSILISSLIFILINFVYSNIDILTQKSNLKAGFYVSEQVNSINTLKNVENLDSKNYENEQYTWYIEIPVIGLKAQISEGTTKEVMDEFVGHFEETSKWIGNVGLASHNRGYEKNYFSELKKLKQEDEIIYFYNNQYRKYVVEKHIIIQDTNWDYLEQTEENKITLITCVENEPNYRRCIQAIEK